MYKIKTRQIDILVDTLTPVSIYQKIRSKYAESILLESSDYGANDNSYAYICFNPISHICVNHNTSQNYFLMAKKKKYP